MTNEPMGRARMDTGGSDGVIFHRFKEKQMSLSALHTYLIPPKRITPVHRSVATHGDHRGRGNNAGGRGNKQFMGQHDKERHSTPKPEVRSTTPPAFDTYWLRNNATSAGASGCHSAPATSLLGGQCDVKG